MGNIVLQIAICILLPSLFLCLFLDGNGRRLIVSLISGLFACIIMYAVDNYLIAGINGGGISAYYITTISPIFEELCKLIPIFILLKRTPNTVKDIVGMSFTVGVGFCVVENLYFLVSSSSTSGFVWMLSRCIGSGLMHSISATVMGIGLSFSLNDKRLRLEFFLSAYFFAVMYHGLFNLLAQNPTLKFIAVLIPVISYFAITYFVYKDEIDKIMMVEEE